MKILRFTAALLWLLLLAVMPVNASVTGSPPKVIDDADLLTDSEEQHLTTQIEELISKYQIDIVIATEYDITADSIQDEADLLYDNNDYGIGKTNDGILFLVAIDPGEWALSTCGNAIDMFSDYDLDFLGGEAASEYFSEEAFYEGFVSYLDNLDWQLDYQMNGDNEPNDDSVFDSSDTATDTDFPTQRSSTNPFHILLATFCGLVITFIIMNNMKSGMKTARKQNNASSYQAPDAASRIQKEDIFLTTRITKRPLPKDPEPGSQTRASHNNTATHTTTVHRSSSGHTHGGRSGKF